MDSTTTTVCNVVGDTAVFHAEVASCCVVDATASAPDGVVLVGAVACDGDISHVKRPCIINATAVAIVVAARNRAIGEDEGGVFTDIDDIPFCCST